MIETHLSRPRLLARAVVLLLVLLAVGVGGIAPAGAAPTSPPAQEVQGSGAQPRRCAADVTYSSWPGGQRTVYTAVGSNGHVGYTIELDEAVEGGEFELTTLGGLLGNADFDIAFYASFTPTVSTATVMTRGVGGETSSS